MAGNDPTPTPAKTAGELLKETQEQERKTGGPGAFVRTPKQQMLDASDIAAKHPELHLRWVNIRDTNKARSRQLEGYSSEPLGKDAIKLGDELALMAIPRALAEQRRAASKQAAEERLRDNRDEYQAAVETVARFLRDKHGLRSADVDRILINHTGG